MSKEADMLWENSEPATVIMAGCEGCDKRSTYHCPICGMALCEQGAHNHDEACGY